MQEWEYLAMYEVGNEQAAVYWRQTSNGTEIHFNEQLAVRNFKQMLANVKEEGWQLLGIIKGPDKYFVYYFKRPASHFD